MDMSNTGVVEQAAEDLWRRTLGQIPTRFGQLAYLASLRTAGSRTYEHHGFATRFSPEVAEAVIRQSHHQAQLEWMGMNLAQASADLEQYLDGLPQGRAVTLATWLKLRDYEQFAPPEAPAPLLDHYLTQMRLLVELLSPGAGVDATDPDDLPPPRSGR